ncbi:MAG: CvpA family protein [Flavobacteriales bacterium]|nr:CvpA family protein [Flavobacteriales bacterium]
MNILDIILLIPLIWSGYKGATKGLVIGLASVVALVLGVAIAIQCSDWGMQWLSHWWETDRKVIRVTSFALIFLLVLIGVHLLAKVLNKMVAWTGLAWANYLGGAIFGLLKTGLILSVVMMMVQQVKIYRQWVDQDLREHSLLYEPVERLAPFLLPHLDDIRAEEWWNRDLMKQLPEVP